MDDPDFEANAEGLELALELLRTHLRQRTLDRPHDSFPRLPESIPATLPENGRGAIPTLRDLAPLVVGGATPLDHPGSFAHMDPPAPWIAWAATLWNAALNQNLLHPGLAPAAGPIEARVVGWLAPYFGMDGGHMVPGSTVANLTALWAAREVRGVREVVASEAAHFSLRKSARILGLGYRSVPVGADQRMQVDKLGDLSRSALVLTAGTTATGSIDPLCTSPRPAPLWLHVDAAWAGPLRLTDRYRGQLDGVEHADSVGFSAHKWLFQPKESALVMFRDSGRAHAALAHPAEYLAAPTVGILGSHGAAAVPLLATLMAWGRAGLSQRVERCMEVADRLAHLTTESPELELWRRPTAGIVLWRRKKWECAEVARRLRASAYLSTIPLAGATWLRSVVANPMADADHLVRSVLAL